MPNFISTERIVRRHLRKVQGSAVKNFERLINEALQAIEKTQRWLKSFGPLLRKALTDTEGLPPGRVWYDLPAKFWKGHPDQGSLFRDLRENLEDLALDVPTLQPEATRSQNALIIPPKARIEFPMNSIKFYPRQGKEHISYDVVTLKQWAENLEAWCRTSKKELATALKRARRKLPDDKK